MTRIWRAEGMRRWITAPFLWIGSWMQTLFPETGEEIPFRMVNHISVSADGTTRMTFERTFSFPGVHRRFQATMRFCEREGLILDALGAAGFLLVELEPSIREGAITICSGRQWLTFFGLPLRIRLPGFLVAHATIHEWQESEDSLGIRVAISNPLLGPFFGYEGAFHSCSD